MHRCGGQSSLGVGIGLLVLGAALVIPFSDARASGQDCSLEGTFQTLQAVQDHPLSNYDDTVKAELAARKNLLNAVLNCAVAETETLKGSIAALPADDQASKNLQSQFASKFDEAIGYYQFQKSRVSDLGLEGTKEFARNLKEWRSAVYAPLSQQAANFIIWTKNQTLFETAQNRFGQIKRTLTLLKLADDETIQKLLRNADADLRAASESNDRAREALQRFGAPDDSSSLIKDTLSSLAATYQTFFDIANALGKTR